MKLSEIRSRVLDNLDSLEDSQGDLWVPDGNDYTRLDRLINDAYHEVAVVAERADPTFGTLAPVGDGVYIIQFSLPKAVLIGRVFYEEALPEDFRRLISLIRNEVTPRVVTMINESEAPFYAAIDQGDVAYLRHDLDGSSGGRTYVGFPNLASSGTAKYALRYAARIPDLAGADDQSQVPDEYQHLVVLGATVRALLEENSDASGFKKLYDQGLALMSAALPRRDGQAVRSA